MTNAWPGRDSCQSSRYLEVPRISVFNWVRPAPRGQAHEELLDAEPPRTVPDVALRWGFTHTGRFAAAYRQKYGVSPRSPCGR
ncbi:helix-turn-helix domain-containing protein [Rhodococcus tukisamuensis]|uniref:helix-turn-helix domain-containing protein n=1 Tax=Rhodococcus tukisamuensis TaxID=168276 RepID=UPI0009F8B5E7|nr:helix-turn-helix domain-containing protein [Rhodococcus tukisamuensis]